LARIGFSSKTYETAGNPGLKAATFGASDAIIGFTPSAEFHHHPVQLC